MACATCTLLTHLTDSTQFIIQITISKKTVSAALLMSHKESGITLGCVTAQQSPVWRLPLNQNKEMRNKREGAKCVIWAGVKLLGLGSGS